MKYLYRGFSEPTENSCGILLAWHQHVRECYNIYSKTSDSGPSEIGTLYNKPLNKGRFSRSQIIGLLIILIHFEPPRRGQPLYKGQNTSIYIGPKVSFVRRFGCIHKTRPHLCLIIKSLTCTCTILRLHIYNYTDTELYVQLTGKVHYMLQLVQVQFWYEH